MSPAHPHICHSQHSDNVRGRPALNSPLKIGLLYLMRSPGYRTLYWDELSVLSSISFVTYLTVWQVELITPDRIYPKWLKLPHLESQGGQRGGRKLRQNRKKIRFIMVNDVCNGRGHLFPNMETGKIWRKIGSIPHSHICDWVISSEKIWGTFDLFISPHYNFLQQPSPACSAF